MAAGAAAAVDGWKKEVSSSVPVGGGDGGKKEKDRADGEVASAVARDAGGVGSGIGSSGEQGDAAVDLVQDEVLLDDDNAEKPAHFYMYEQSVMRSLTEPRVKDVARSTPSNDDYYPRVAITALMRVLQDGSQVVHHSSVTQVCVDIFIGP